MTVVAPLEVRLYSAAGSLIDVLDEALTREYQDANSDVGSGSVELRVLDPLFDSVEDRGILKFSFLGDIRFGCRLNFESATYGDSGTVVSFKGLGLLSLLDDGLILNEAGGMPERTTGQRWFGWPAADFDDSTWTTGAQSGFQYRDRASSSAERKGNPPEWPNKNAWWMHVPGAGNWQMFRRSVVVPSDSVLRIYVSADEDMQVYWAGEKLIDVKQTETGYTDMATFDLGTVPAGTYQLAIGYRTKATPIIGDGFDGMIFTLGVLNAYGEPSSFLASSDMSASWRFKGQAFTARRPGMTLGHIMRVSLEEAQARGACLLVNLGFSDTTDSDGQAWDDDDLFMGVDEANTNLREWLLQLAEGRADVGFDADAMEVLAYNQRGTDKTGTVELLRASNLTKLSTSRTHDVVNDGWARLSDGSFVHVEEGSSVGAYGRVERGIDFGSLTPGSGDDETAKLVAIRAAPIDELEADTAMEGAVPYGDGGPDPFYVIGDVVTASAHRDGTGPARVLGITVSHPRGKDYADVTPELAPVSDNVLIPIPRRRKTTYRERRKQVEKATTRGSLNGDSRTPTSLNYDPPPSRPRTSRPPPWYQVTDGVEPDIKADGHTPAWVDRSDTC